MIEWLKRKAATLKVWGSIPPTPGSRKNLPTQRDHRLSILLVAAFSILRIGKTEKLPPGIQTVNIELEEFQAHDEEEIDELPITISLCYSAVNEYTSGNCP